MPTLDVVVQSDVRRTFRVEQLAGMFDVPLEEKIGERFEVELPADDEDWQLGAIVGPSGSGKSTIAREAYGKRLISGYRWPKDQAFIDGFPESLSIKQVTHALTAVGFSSPPSWVKPFAALSNGERFRADLARSLLDAHELVAFDEFTSVVDRTVAKIGSAAVSKAIRKGRVKRKFVAVTFHYDVLEWLEPDWVLDMASCQLARGCLRRRPEIRLDIAPVHHSAWQLFRRHHYLSGNLNKGSTCFCAFWNDRPVAFSSWVSAGPMGNAKKKDWRRRREHRTVVLPDFQGVGIGVRLSNYCAALLKTQGLRAFSTTGHPAMIAYRSRSPLWRRHRLGYVSPERRPNQLARQRAGGVNTCASDRITAGFEYIGPPLPAAEAAAVLAIEPRQWVVGAAGMLEAIHRAPGSTAGRLCRITGLSGSGCRRQLEALIANGQILQRGTGGSRDPYAFYPAEIG